MSKVLLLLSLCLGAEARIKAPETAPVGQYVRIDGLGSTGTLTWSVPDKDVSVFTSADSTSVVVFCPSPRRVKVRLTAADAAGKSSDAEVVDFVGDVPAPKPGPKPGPAPAPAPAPHPTPLPDDAPLPDGRFKVASPARERARQVKAERAAQRHAEAQQMAAKLAEVQARIRSGEIDTANPVVLVTAIREANSQLPRDVQSRWTPWGNWWCLFLRGLWMAGNLKTAADWILILEETILGLRSVPSQ